MMSTVQKWGNSLAVRIPANLANQMKLQDGSEVEVLAEDGAIMVVPVTRRKFDLDELLKNCKPSQLHGETDWGGDVGREVID
jgi:antitoxin MazE